jgi:lipoprotein-anchoring transpeptidase ErfK/SrfK
MVITVLALMTTHDRPVKLAAATPKHATAAGAEGQTAGTRRYKPAATPTSQQIQLPADSATSCGGNQYDQLILVSISAQHLWVCEGSRQVNQTAVTTGNTDQHDDTPLGSWRLQGKQTDRYLVGPGYKDYVQYWMPFDGDYGLHDASWQKIPFGSAQYRSAGSHGCVHVPNDVMAWLYQWSAVDQTVVTIES